MLTTTQATKVKPRLKEFNLSCGKVAGLHLRIKPSGGKHWVFNYTRPLTKKRTNLGLGKYPALSLAQAREKAEYYRSQLANGLDPKTERDRLEKEQTTVERELPPRRGNAVQLLAP
ncbi:MAG TPA: DUF4102 domain-containing protein, partial [Gammaproteobacteria bacterium]|nr:DUF4102 domain-containing protein [Gammaproteobacteria bacterium]